MKKLRRFPFAVFCFSLLSFLSTGLLVNAQSSRDLAPGSSPSPTAAATADTALPLKRIALFSSGVAYFEHSGNVRSSQGPTEILLPFDSGAVNDALKSLVVNDPASTSPSVRYASQNTLERTLKSLKIDLSGTPGIGDILNSLKGAELEVAAPFTIKGRIIAVEYRHSAAPPVGQQYGYPPARPAEEAWVSLFTSEGIRSIAIRDIASFRFTDGRINSDLNRALDLIMTSRDENTRNLFLTLNGTASRNVSFSYVIPSPVWKVSYRLDLAGSTPFLQGWAIVDNDSDTDWQNVQLSLVIGRPVSFIQNLYPPYRLTRPTLPLAIAGIAESRTYESGYGAPERASRLSMMAREASPSMEMAMDEVSENSYGSYMQAPQAAPSVSGGTMQTAAGSTAGDQFLFTLKNPVTLERRQSAMLPLVEGAVKAEKTLIFSGSRAASGSSINPGISAELTNTSGMKLPAGPITVYDGGTYAGDALIEFFPVNEKRFISYGEDLSVTGNVSSSNIRNITGVSVSGGVMTIIRRQSYEKVYTIRNASDEAKKLIVEHPILTGYDLAEPATADDRTGSLYRFKHNLAAKQTLTFKVREETPISERVTLAQLRPETFLSYASNHEIPSNVRAVLSRAIELKKTADDAAAAQLQLENQQSRLISEQDRIRRNLEAAGSQTPQGQDYLKRLSSLDSDIDALNTRINAATRETEKANKAYADYLTTISI